MSPNELKLILEALLMASQQPLSVEKMIEVFEDWEKPTRAEIVRVLSFLEQDYQGRAVVLTRVASGYRFQTKPEYVPRITKILSEKPTKYSKALIETLAIIAYRQPVTRADIEQIRGVAVNSQIIKTLLEREWIRIAGHREVPGRPAVYMTTRCFLDYFNLQRLDELPAISLEELAHDK